MRSDTLCSAPDYAIARQGGLEINLLHLVGCSVATQCRCGIGR
jgi:hypothetical protein